MTPEEQERTIADAERLASRMIELASAARTESLTAVAYSAWVHNPALMPMAMVMWFSWAQDAHGKPEVDQVIAAMTEQVSQAPVQQAATRLVFCEVMFAMQDQDAPRMNEAWGRLVDAGDWAAAVEVIGLVLSFVGYFMGWPGDGPG